MDQIERSFSLVCAEWAGGPRHAYDAVHGGKRTDAEQMALVRAMVERAVQCQRGIAEIVTTEWVDGVAAERTICVETLGLPVPRSLIDWTRRPSWHFEERFERLRLGESDVMYGVDGVLLTAETRVNKGVCWCCGRNELAAHEKPEGLCFVCEEVLAAEALEEDQLMVAER